MYVIPEERGKGLGKWLIQCISEVLGEMKDLRNCLLFCSGERAEDFYGKILGAKRRKEVDGGSMLMQRSGPGAVVKGEKEVE